MLSALDAHFPTMREEPRIGGLGRVCAEKT